MKKILFIIFLTVSWVTNGQILDPVKWNTQIKHVDGDEYELIWTATMDPGWKVYSQYLERDDGPIATSLNFDEGSHFELVGPSTEDDINKEEGFDKIFEMNLTKYHDEMIIRQRVRILDTSKPIQGFLQFMTCDDIQCLAPTDVDFHFAVDGTSEKKDGDDSRGSAKNMDVEEIYGIPRIDLNEVPGDCSNSNLSVEEEKSNWGIFLLGMLGGLLALLTPCVFPMIPLTVSFFTKKDQSGKGMGSAIMYGFFILLVYVLLSIPFHLLDQINPDILNEVSTNVWLNILFFVVFLLFAFSFFGFYELQLPTSWSNRISSAEGIGGVLGVFFMALTLALVSFSCTGPILGSLLAGALTSDGGAWQLTAGMSGFGLALALPFAIFAMFPNWMQKIPKSGGWLNTVKVTLGFLELALALKFLSNADLVQHWGILKIEIFYGLWIVIFFVLALYLFGRIRFSGDGPAGNLSWGRKISAIIALGIAAYLGTGFQYDEARKTYEPLKLLSGLAPPAGYSWFHPSKCPNNLDCFNDLNEGIAYAKENDKPIMLDFTGYACVNCRKMEEHVWPEDGILNLLEDEYVLISLYVDDKRELPEAEQLEVQRINGGTRKLKNHGHKWAHFQTSYFGVNSQPFYVLLTPDGKTMLNKPANYTPDPSDFKEFLECGLETHKKMNTFGSGIFGTNP